jgi:hypothetical protein
MLDTVAVQSLLNNSYASMISLDDSIEPASTQLDGIQSIQ